MIDREEAFLDEVCSKVKYKTAHKEIRAEMRSHIKELSEECQKASLSREQAVDAAVRRMGDAEEIGRELNRLYRLPFNCRFGLSIWAALMTITAYLLYPPLYKIYDHTIKAPCPTVCILGAILIFMLGNIMYLRRGRLIFSLKDIGCTAIGFIIGWVIVQSGLLLVSEMMGIRGFYPYMSDVKILFASPYVPLVLKELSVFAMEGFCLWICIMVYMSAIKSKKVRKSGFIFAACFPGGYFAHVEVDDNFYGQRSEYK